MIEPSKILQLFSHISLKHPSRSFTRGQRTLPPRGKSARIPRQASPIRSRGHHPARLQTRSPPFLGARPRDDVLLPSAACPPPQDVTNTKYAGEKCSAPPAGPAVFSRVTGLTQTNHCPTQQTSRALFLRELSYFPGGVGGPVSRVFLYLPSCHPFVTSLRRWFLRVPLFDNDSSSR